MTEKRMPGAVRNIRDLPRGPGPKVQRSGPGCEDCAKPGVSQSEVTTSVKMRGELKQGVPALLRRILPGGAKKPQT